jgi:hypothetical protein
MTKLIKNDWRRVDGAAYERAAILSRSTCPEGLDVERIRFVSEGRWVPDASSGHIVSLLRGRATIGVLTIVPGVHVYLPPRDVVLTADAGTELIHVSAPKEQARGEHMLVRDEQFLSACAVGSQSLRWILTPQYLSRRIFLHHDRALVSKSNHPVSWFRTTMFDVSGLPKNEDGEAVFKMSYNSRTEFNVCYDVAGVAKVRMAQHPYRTKSWDGWLRLDGESTYHLNEAAGGPEEEASDDGGTLRNRHEVHIDGGHVSLFCLFDPAPTGIERHRPGEYSDYEPITRILGTEEYRVHQQEIGKLDEMIDRLSVAKAQGELGEHEGSALFELYVAGREAQRAIEATLAKGSGRESVLARWMQSLSR